MSWAEKVIRKARIDDPGASDQLRRSVSLSLALWLQEMQSPCARQEGCRKLADLQRLVWAADPGIGQIRARLRALSPVARLAVLRAAHRGCPASSQAVGPACDLACDLVEWAGSCPASELLAGLRAAFRVIEPAESLFQNRSKEVGCDEMRLVAYLASDLAHLARLELPAVIAGDALRDLVHALFPKVTDRKADTTLRRFRAGFKAPSHRTKLVRGAGRPPSREDRLSI